MAAEVGSSGWCHRRLRRGRQSLHQVLDVVPASIALFLLSVLGNFIFIYGGDLLSGTHRDGSPPL